MINPRIFLTATACFLAATATQMVAQTTQSILLFGPVNVRMSASTTSYDNPAFFNSNTLNLTCPASPVATLSSTTDSSGNVLVDNNINVTVTAGESSEGPTNVCVGGVSNPSENCFTTTYQGPAGDGQLNGVDPDHLLPDGGVPPIDIHQMLTSGQQQVKIDLEDEGGWLTSSTLYLNTNCTNAGVSGGTISGNTIPSSNPTTQDLTQNFPFNSGANNGVNFQYDLTTAGSLNTNSNGSTPSVNDAAVDPATWVPTWAPSTSFATSACLQHSGEIVLPGGVTPACKLYTLDCTVGTGSQAAGANCPVATSGLEAFRDIFDGPAFSLPDIVNVGGPTFHEGMGFLMASERWTGGPCKFATGSGFENNLCPMNVLETFSGPGSFTNTGGSSHPNSTFISISAVPEDLTTVTATGVNANNWINTDSTNLTFSSQPPTFAGVVSPPAGAANFVAAPIQSITYGVSAADNVPAPGAPVPGDTMLPNSIACPTSANPTQPAATTFTPPQQGITFTSDGRYAVHYFAQDCAGTLELKFTQDNAGSWSTNFYTFPINVDTTDPVVATGPTLSPAGPYAPGQLGVMATFRCTDSLSGVMQCGGQSFSSDPLNTGNVTVPVKVSTTPGMYTFSVFAMDAAGNQSVTASVPYTVVAADTQVQITLASGTVTYPLGTNLEVLVSKINSHVPTGTVQIVDNGVTTITTLSLNKAGDAFFYVKNLSAGMHSLTAMYSGDAFNPGGTSAPVILNVLPVSVTQAVACWNTPAPYGSNFQCNVHETSTAGPAPGSITYVYDANPPASAALSSGAVLFAIPKPAVGNHTLVISYPGAPNFAAAGPQTVNFVVTAH